MLKRILSAVIAIAVCVAALTGCAGSNDAEAVEPIGEFTEDKTLLRDITALPEGSLKVEPKRLTEEIVEILNAIFDERESDLAELDPDELEHVTERDWGKYASALAKSRLDSSELALYEALNDFCESFLSEPFHYGTLDNTSYISSGTVNYAELGLDYRQAADVFTWFKYSNPQFYFLDSFAYTDTDMYLTVYGFASDFDDPVHIANELFDKLDGWVSECAKEKTVLGKITAANRLICENTKCATGMAADGRNQSLYSVLIGGEAACLGYALAFTALTNAMSVEAYTVAGSTYAWNTARFENGKYYYADIFRNDSIDGNGFGDIFIGIGTDYAVYYDNGGRTYTVDSYGAHLLPSVSVANYEGSDSIGALNAPKLRIGGSGNRVVRLEWDEISGAEKYECSVSAGSTVYTISSSAVTFMYVSFPESSDAVNVKIRAVGSDNGKRVYSAFTESVLTVTNSSNKPAMPANIASDNENGNVILSWDKNNNVDGWLVIAYGEDSTFTGARMIYAPGKNRINLGNVWQSDSNVYFSVMSVEKNDNTEIYSDPVKIRYNKNDGAAVLSGNGSGSNNSSNGSNSSYPDGDNVTVEFSNGIYVGKMENGMRNGHGRLSVTNGDIYEGEWKNDALVKGTITNHLSNGVYIYESDNFINDRTNGQSTHTVRFDSGDVSVLSGNASNGVISGNGRLEYTYSSGERYVYEGELEDGIPSGNGVKTYTHTDGTTSVEDGVFINGAIVSGEITDKYSNGTYIYESNNFSNGLMNGESKRTIKFNGGDISIISGTATDGDISGEGTLDYYYARGSRFCYEGELRNFEMYGNGVKTTYYADGSYLVENGTFNVGLRNGTYIHYNSDGSVRVERRYVDGQVVA